LANPGSQAILGQALRRPKLLDFFDRDALLFDEDDERLEICATCEGMRKGPLVWREGTSSKQNKPSLQNPPEPTRDTERAALGILERFNLKASLHETVSVVFGVSLLGR